MSDWKTRHPFTVGQKVYPRIGGRAERLGLAQPRTVAMRGAVSYTHLTLPTID